MKTIRHTTTLFYYDGPQVIEARDAIGGHYVAVLVDQDRYLVAGVAPERLRQFRAGTLDLRSLLLERGEDEWYLATTPSGLDQLLALEAQNELLADSGLLPDPGFVLQDCPAETETSKESSVMPNLGAKPVTVEGELDRADATRGDWRIVTSQDAFCGKVKIGGPSLKGLKIGSTYRFSCIEKIEEINGTGREQRTLYLIDHEPA